MNKKLKIISLIIIGFAAVFGIYFLVKRITSGTIVIPNKETPSQESITVGEPVSSLHVPEDFTISYYAKNVAGARDMAIDPRGRMLVSSTDKDTVVVIEDTDNDGTAEKHTTLLQNLNDPHGLAFKCEKSNCVLYVAEHDKLSSYLYDVENTSISGGKKLLDISAAKTDRHYTRSLLFLPSPNQDTLLISVGSSCNVCDDAGMRGKIIAYNTTTGAVRDYATGLRNAVFMTLHPETQKVFAVDMGRDGLGDDTPPDEINIIKDGGNYGWPICYGKNIHDTNFDKKTYIRNPCMEPFEIESFVDLQAHSAPLGLDFIPKDGWISDYQNDLLVAYHGSWNRSVPTGYKIARLKMDADGNYQGTEDFITGWLSSDGKKLGRPVDVMALPNGVIYISDDAAGVIYRVVQTK